MDFSSLSIFPFKEDGYCDQQVRTATSTFSKIQRGIRLATVAGDTSAEAMAIAI